MRLHPVAEFTQNFQFTHHIRSNQINTVVNFKSNLTSKIQWQPLNNHNKSVYIPSHKNHPRPSFYEMTLLLHRQPASERKMTCQSFVFVTFPLNPPPRETAKALQTKSPQPTANNVSSTNCKVSSTTTNKVFSTNCKQSLFNQLHTKSPQPTANKVSSTTATASHSSKRVSACY